MVVAPEIPEAEPSMPSTSLRLASPEHLGAGVCWRHAFRDQPLHLGDFLLGEPTAFNAINALFLTLIYRVLTLIYRGRLF
jgi:hypothetical protein